jgi:ABC-2 type transport system permease protein
VGQGVEEALMATLAPAPVAAARLAGGTLRDDARAAAMVWRREAIRFRRNGLRILTSVVQPVLYLFVLGTGLSSIVKGGLTSTGFSFKTFIFPGVIGMTVLFNAIFSSISIVWDREFGFLREMLVAPVRRGALVVGKCLGGGTTAAIQGFIMLVLAGLVGVPYSPLLLATLAGCIVLMALAITAVGIAIAARLQQVESFQAVMQFFVLPMFFLSGAMYPTSSLPSWLAVLTKLDPLTYVIDPMRRAVFAHVAVPPGVAQALNQGVSWNGWRLPVGLELGMVAAFGLACLAVAVRQFSRQD